MTVTPTDTIIDQLAADVRPVKPLRTPAVRAFLLLTVMTLAIAAAVTLVGDVAGLRARYSGREALMALEMAAMLATGMLAIIGAFFLSIPGPSKRWIAAPIPTFVLWLTLSGVGCYGDFVRRGEFGLESGIGLHCLLFIVATSAVLAPPLIWRLSRARPIDPLPVALLGGLGVAAFSALALQFFHPLAVTAVDLALHLVAIVAVVGSIALLNRRTLAPA